MTDRRSKRRDVSLETTALNLMRGKAARTSDAEDSFSVQRRAPASLGQAMPHNDPRSLIDLSEGRPMTIAITIEADPAGLSRATFRMIVNGAVVGEGLVAAEAHRVVGKLIDRIALGVRPKLPRIDAEFLPRAARGRIATAKRSAR
jgi:hypothetical protein